VVKDAAGMPLTRFNPPLKICFRYTQSELDRVNDDPTNFLIQTFQNGAWESLPTTPEGDPSPSVLGRVCAPVDHLTLFALFNRGEPVPEAVELEGSLAEVKFLPETGMSPVGSWGGLIGGLVVGIVMWVVLRRKYD
jgi:hypothetical protein